MKFSIRDLMLIAQEQHPPPLGQLACFGAIIGIIALAVVMLVFIAARKREPLPNSSAPAPKSPEN